jgi:hypothetical protein
MGRFLEERASGGSVHQVVGHGKSRSLVPFLLLQTLTFEETLKGPFLILSDWYHLCYRRRAPRSSRGMLVAIINEGRRTSGISLGLRVVNLKSGGRRRHKGARPSNGMFAAEGRSCGKH